MAHPSPSTAIAEPVVQATGAALPELHRAGATRKPPQKGGRGTASARETGFVYCAAAFQLLAAGYWLALGRGPGAHRRPRGGW